MSAFAGSTPPDGMEAADIVLIVLGLAAVSGIGSRTARAAASRRR